jgi:hypothetical protein
MCKHANFAFVHFFLKISLLKIVGVESVAKIKTFTLPSSVEFKVYRSHKIIFSVLVLITQEKESQDEKEKNLRSIDVAGAIC